jgi:hypothetical protein
MLYIHLCSLMQFWLLLVFLFGYDGRARLCEVHSCLLWGSGFEFLKFRINLIIKKFNFPWTYDFCYHSREWEFPCFTRSQRKSYRSTSITMFGRLPVCSKSGTSERNSMRLIRIFFWNLPLRAILLLKSYNNKSHLTWRFTCVSMRISEVTRA